MTQHTRKHNYNIQGKILLNRTEWYSNTGCGSSTARNLLYPQEIRLLSAYMQCNTGNLLYSGATRI